MTRTARIALTLALICGVGLVALLLTNRSRAEDPRADVMAGESALVRANSHRLSIVPDGRVTLVEFLDFECEACGGVYPLVEKLRQEYGERVSFVVRYFPIPSHVNAERAARAAEAAAQQGKFEQMYQRLYETQSVWGEQRTPKDDVFRIFAADLGLDLAAFDAAYNDPATLDRIRADIADGTALGVDATPTFFLNGQRITPRSYQDLSNALDQALR
ncbi:thioredoxin domain-containing protein [Nocardia ninae]|uniref:Thioredoxin domain-containing protein n=1 Tax=Nocardia ninae NBRC 108245 TaxID=1210091 RepID=A0A511M744_9NOCA|nr:thioredoxin domain-containing protein [Nocardia ninae]GEM36475.1 hypothetical protein NN4_09940 [Nocardia ninae NBRC 108245]